MTLVKFANIYDLKNKSVKKFPLHLADFYKMGHYAQYPDGTTMVYSNFTPRKSRVPWTNEVMFFGFQYFLEEYLVRVWNEEFFFKPKAKVIRKYKRRMDSSLGIDSVSTEHIEKLHDLGYLPIKIKALPEGTMVPIDSKGNWIPIKGKEIQEVEAIGAYEEMYKNFSGPNTSKGFKQLDTHVGLIYGDSITMDRQREILKRLENKGFCASNLVLGIGSFTYQYVTRDVYGMAMKATYVEINGIGKEIWKDPITDDGMKKSARGLIRVHEDLTYSDQVSWQEEEGGLLETVFLDGKIVKRTTLKEIRDRVNKHLS